MNDKVTVFVAGCGHLMIYEPSHHWEANDQRNVCLACTGSDGYHIYSHLDKQRIAWNRGDA